MYMNSTKSQVSGTAAAESGSGVVTSMPVIRVANFKKYSQYIFY